MHIKRLTVLAAIVSLALAGCGGTSTDGSSDSTSSGAGENSSGSEQTGGAGTTVLMAIQDDIGNLDPQSATSNDLTQFKNFTYDRLIYQSIDGELLPWLASKWDDSPTSVTFTLRDGVTCSDGSELTAEDVAENYRQIVAEDSTSPWKGLSVPPDAQVAVDGKDITISTGSPFPFFLQSIGDVPIICAKGLADRTYLADHSDGTGPYALESVVQGSKYVLAKRDGYAWNPVKGSDAWTLPDKVELTVVSNQTTAANMLLNKELNIATISGPDVTRLLDAGVESGTSEQAVGEFWLNQNEGYPTVSEDLRRGIVQALDLSQLTTVLTDGRGYKTKSMVTLEPVACPGDPIGDRLPTHDLDAASKSFAAAGYTANANGRLADGDGTELSFDIIYPNKWGQPMADAVELMAQQLDAVGITSNIQGFDGPAFSKALFQDHAFDIAWDPFTMDSPRLLRPLVATPENGGVINFSGINNPKHEELIEKAVLKPGTAGCDDWLAAESTLYDAVNVVPFASTDVHIFRAGGVDFDVVKGSVAPWTLHING